MKAIKSITSGDFKAWLRFDLDESSSCELNLTPEEEEKRGSKIIAHLKHFFRLFKSKETAEEKFFMRKLFTRYNMAIKLILSSAVFFAVFNEAVYWLDSIPETTVAEGFFKFLFFLLVGIMYLLLVTNNSKNKYQYFRILILIIIFGGTLIKILELEYIILIKNEPGDL
jgi:hypothetical protein